METESAAEADGASPENRSSGSTGVGFWSFIAFDACFFFLLFFQFSMDRSSSFTVFESGQRALLAPLAMVNTLVLVTGSWLVALAVRSAHRGEARKGSCLMFAGAACGVVFAVVKIAEYVREFEAGNSISTSEFFTYYFVITGVHLVHLIAGTIALVLVGARLWRRRQREGDQTVLQCVAAYWHLVDLLWLFIFPLLYLVR